MLEIADSVLEIADSVLEIADSVLEIDAQFSASETVFFLLLVDLVLFPALTVDLPVLWTLQMLHSSMYFVTAVLGK